VGPARLVWWSCLLGALGGCQGSSPPARLRSLLAPPSPPAARVSWTPLDPGSLEVAEEHAPRNVRYLVRLPAGSGWTELELRFRDGLDGARVDATGSGPRQSLTLLEGRRIGGNTVTIHLAPVPLEVVEVVVHRHFRPLPLVAGVRLGRP
jgi:hypothetical protein